MKKIHILLLAALSFNVQGQTPFSTIDSVSINNINAAVLVHGDMWWNPVAQAEHCFYPANAKTNISFNGSLWMSGYDAGNDLHVAAQTYRQSGNDYWPGPLDASDTLTYTTSQKWAKIWKVNRTDIHAFQAMATHNITNTPPAILTWPAKGNTNVQGNGGAALTITEDMAPFTDLNSNGIYEPLLGEYPDVPGDQALWWVFSDNGPAHTQTNGKPLKVEVHAMAYAYSRGSLIDNVIYYDYELVNKSANNYHNFRFSQYAVTEIGYFNDDYIGFDSVWRMGIAYNSNNADGASAGFPVGSFGTDPPQSAVTMIVQPGDAGTNYVPAGGFMYFNNDASIVGNPVADTEYNHYMHTRIRNGKPIDSISGPAPCAVTNSNYVVPGDPSDITTWNEFTCNNIPGSRRFILSSNDFAFNAGSKAHAVFALIVADSAKGGATGFHDIKIMADTAWKIYHNPLASPFLSVENNATAGKINIYPNPAHDMLYIEDKARNPSDASITICNAMGQKVIVPHLQNGQTYKLDISKLPAGLYYIRYQNGNIQASTKFLKE